VDVQKTDQPNEHADTVSTQNLPESSSLQADSRAHVLLAVLLDVGGHHRVALNKGIWLHRVAREVGVRANGGVKSHRVRVHAREHRLNRSGGGGDSIERNSARLVASGGLLGVCVLDWVVDNRNHRLLVGVDLLQTGENSALNLAKSAHEQARVLQADGLDQNVQSNNSVGGPFTVVAIQNQINQAKNAQDVDDNREDEMRGHQTETSLDNSGKAKGHKQRSQAEIDDIAAKEQAKSRKNHLHKAEEGHNTRGNRDTVQQLS